MLRLIATLLIAVGLCTTASAAEPSAQPAAFVETFAAPTSDWTFTPAENVGKGWLQWSPVSTGRPGWIFQTRGRVAAHRPWEVGTQPFVLDFEIEMDRGKRETWRMNGASVMISSAPVYEMTADDVGLAITVMQSGVQAAVKTGPFWELEWKDEWGKARHQFPQRDSAPRGILSRSGGGGHWQSWTWPALGIGGDKLRCRIERNNDHYVRFTLYHSAGDPTAPVWEGVWQLPAGGKPKVPNLRDIPLRYVNVLTTLNTPPTETKEPPAVTVLAGRITNLTGITAPGSLPQVSGYVGQVADGQTIRIKGQHFSDGAVASLNGTPVQTRRLDANTLDITLKGVQTDQANHLSVVNPDGGANFYPMPLRAGRVVEKVVPAELRQSGGEVITLRGRGFDENTRVTADGKPLEVVELVDSTALRVRTAAGKLGRVKLDVRGEAGAFEVQPVVAYAAHPYLLIQPEDVARLRERFNAPHMKHYRAMILRLADRSADPAAMTPRAMTLGDYGEHIWATAWGYLLTGEAKYKDAAIRWIAGTVGPNDVLASMDPTRSEELRLQHAATGGFTAADPDPSNPGILRQFLDKHQFQIQRGAAVAIAYDVLFEELDPELRGRMLDYLDSHIDTAVPLIRSKDWWYAGNPSNTVTVANGAVGLMALSHKEIRDDVDELAKLTTDVIKRTFKSIEADGGSVEGTLYWNYGLGAQINLGIALQNTRGDDYGMLNDRRLEKGINFAQVALGGDGNMFVFNDTQPFLQGTVPAALGASRFDQPFMRWLVDQIMERYSQEERIVSEVVRPTYTIAAFLLRGDEPPVETMPPLPTLAHLDVMQWGVMRSRPDAHKHGVVVGIKGQGGVTTHHVHADQGSFVLHAHGEELLLDAGYGYGNALLHSIPIPVKEMPTSADTPPAGMRGQNDAPLLNLWEEGDLRTITVDSTKAYSDGKVTLASKAHRVFALAGEEALVIVDDIVPANGSMRILAQYQTAQEPALNDGGFAIRTPGASARIHLAGPPIDDLSSHARDLTKRGWVYKHMDRNWHSVWGTYLPDPDKPLVTVCMISRGDIEPAEPNVEFGNGTISVTLGGGRTLHFDRKDQMWHLRRP
jgi:hypothetical protein